MTSGSYPPVLKITQTERRQLFKYQRPRKATVIHLQPAARRAAAETINGINSNVNSSLSCKLFIVFTCNNISLKGHFNKPRYDHKIFSFAAVPPCNQGLTSLEHDWSPEATRYTDYCFFFKVYMFIQKQQDFLVTVKCTHSYYCSLVNGPNPDLAQLHSHSKCQTVGSTISIQELGKECDFESSLSKSLFGIVLDGKSLRNDIILLAHSQKDYLKLLLCTKWSDVINLKSGLLSVFTSQQQQQKTIPNIWLGTGYFSIENGV